MAYFYTNSFRTALKANPALIPSSGGTAIKCWTLTAAPSMAFGTTAYVGATNMATLLAMPGWEKAPDTTAVTLTMVSTTISGSTSTFIVIPSGGFPFTQSVRAEAFAFTMPDGSLIGVTNTPIGDHQNIHSGDALTAIKDTAVPLGSSSWFFSWPPAAAGAAMVNITEGPLAMFKSAPAFEAPNTIHAWMYPQRANMIANPSIEEPGVNFWASNGALSRLAHPVGVGGNYLRAAGTIVQSNIWPTQKGDDDEPLWTFQVRLRGNGNAKVGLVYWDRDGRGTGVDWGEYTDDQGVLHKPQWALNAVGWTDIAVNRVGAEAYRAMMRIETDGTFLEIDKALAEHGNLAGSAQVFGYFDGTTTYSLPDDYFWYGGAARQGKSYSMWYGGRRAVVGRLFAAPTDSNTPINVLTDDELREAGLVYQWVPAGTTVVAHIGVLYPDDLVADLVPQAVGSILPYATPTTDGVANPWV